MKNKFFSLLGIIVVTITLLAINEFAEPGWAKDFAFILIVAAMLLGVIIAKTLDKNKVKSKQ